MLTNEQLVVLRALRTSFGVFDYDAETSDAGVSDLESDVSLDAPLVASYIIRNGILPTVYSSLAMYPDVQKMVQMDYYAAVSQNVNQIHEGGLVFTALHEAGMQCMPVKGWDLRNQYPCAAMRQMTDLDVLVHPYSYDAIKDAMIALGYRPDEGESGRKHDIYFKGMVTIEIHKRLTDDSGVIRAWEGDAWERATVDANGIYHMSPEDVFIYHFVHMRRDFGNGWFGLRRVVDAWLLDQQDGLDRDYIDRKLVAMGIAPFVKRMCWLGRVCMGEEPVDEDAELLLRHAFDCGIMGNDTSYKAGRIVSLTTGGTNTGKLQSVLKAIFLPYGRMKAQFPELERHPVLLPVCWARRIVHYLTNGKLHQYRSMLDYHNITDEDVEHMRRVLKAGGC